MEQGNTASALPAKHHPSALLNMMVIFLLVFLQMIVSGEEEGRAVRRRHSEYCWFTNLKSFPPAAVHANERQDQNNHQLRLG